MALIDDFKERFPDFDEAVVDKYFPAVQSDYPLYYNYTYGVSAVVDRIILQCCAHLFVKEKTASDGQIGALSSSSGRGISQSFEQGKQRTSRQIYFGATKYGRDFLEMSSNSPGVLSV